MSEGLFRWAQTLFFALLPGSLLLLAGPSSAETWHPPDLSNTRIKGSVEYDLHTRLYRYEYEISHPATNRGELRYFSLATAIPFPYGEYIDKELLKQSGMSGEVDNECDSPLASGVASVVCAEPAPDWGIGGLKKSVTWTAIAGWGEPPAKTTPGRVIRGFTIYTRVPPGPVIATLSPQVDTGPGSPYQVYGERCEEEEGLCPDLRAFDLKYPTVGPVAQKE